MSADAERQDDLLARIEQALLLRDAGQAVDVDALCSDRPELTGELRAALGMATDLRALQEAAARHDPYLGSLMAGRYQLEQRIGAGSMGVVYQATDRELARAVAVKVLHSPSMVEAEARARFQREGEVLAAITHPAVVTVFDRGSTPSGDLFLVMELLDGQNCSHWIERAREVVGSGGFEALDEVAWPRRDAHMGDLPEPGWLRSVVRWTAELADGLAAAHAAGIRHRDVKPSNIFIRRDGRPVLLDFGIAARSAESTLSTRDRWVGTPAYLAPESLLPHDPGGLPATDVYGLGATLYALITLRPPYAGSLPQVMAQVARRDPRPAHRIRPIPRDLAAILDRALERDPRRRYPTAEAFAADLRALLAYRPVAARPMTAIGRLTRQLSRSREFRVVAALLMVAGLATAWTTWRERDADRRAGLAAVAWSHVPPALQLSSNPALRPCADGAERQRLEQLLTEVVDNAKAPLPARLLRGAFRLDHGDRAGAAQDIAALADLAPSPYLHEVAARYAAAGDGLAIADDLQTPTHAPTTPADHYVAAFHTLRGTRTPQRLKDSIAALSRAGDTEVAEAGELLAMLHIELAYLVEAKDRLEPYRRAHDIALRTEQRLGATTATTAYVMGTALSGQDRAEESLPWFERELTLAPGHFGTLMNLGAALRKQGRPAEASDALRAAIAIRRDVPSTHEILMRARLDLDDFDGAVAVVEGMPLPADTASAQRRSYLRGLTELHRAVRAHSAGQRDAAIAAAKAAVDHYKAAATNSAMAELGIASSLAAGDLADAAPGLLDWLARQPVSWQRLDDYATLLPEELGPEHTSLLRDYLHKLARHLAPQPRPEAEPEPSSTTKPPSAPSNSGRNDR